MKFIKKNKFTIIVIVLIIIFLIVLLQIKNIFFPNIGTGEAVYGNRLDKRVELKEDTLKDIEANVSTNTSVVSIDARVSGKIVNVKITINDQVSISDAKVIGEGIVKYFSTEQLAYYDIQVFMLKSEKITNFPIIGYRHYSEGDFSWTKDREESKTE